MAAARTSLAGTAPRWLAWQLGVVLIASGCGGGGSGQTSSPTGSPTEATTATESPTSSPTGSPTSSPAGTPGAEDSEPAKAAVAVGEPTTVAEGLRAPWGLAVLPDAEALVTVRDTGQVLRTGPAKKPQEVANIAGVRASGEGGLLGIAISPKFAADRYVFVYFTAADDNRIVRYRYVDGEFVSGKEILTGIPKAAVHNGGFLAFGPDGYLYVGTGDAGQVNSAQSWESLGGKILRVTKSGEPAPGNPRAGNPVWSLGHRNVQGFGWDQRGRMFASEFGQDSWDELNRIVAGGNYGWPDVEGEGEQSRYRDPLVTWRPSEASPSGLAVAGDAVYVAALRGEAVWRVPLVGDGVGEPRRLLRGEFGRIRTVAVDAAGNFWIANSNTSRGEPTAQDDRVIVLPADLLS